MIEKIDKPEPPSYRVQSTVETRDRRGQKGGDERREEDEYSASSDKKWQKFHTSTKDRRAVKLRRRDIAGLYFKQVVLQKGLVVIETDIQLVNGQILKNAHLFSTKIDAYWKLKKLNVGQKLPIDQIIKEEYVEVSIFTKQGAVKITEAEKPIEKDFKEGLKIKNKSEKEGWYLWPLFNKDSGKPNWIAIIIYAVIIISVLTALIMII